MTDPSTPVPPTNQPAAEPDVDLTQRPRLVTRLRLVPLAVLCSLVLVAGVVGALNDGVISSEQPAAAAPPKGQKDRTEDPAKVAARISKKCTPGFNTRVRSEPWVGAKKAASERTYKTRIKKENAGYIKGADGNYIFSDLYANNFSQALGRITQSSTKQQQWAKYFTKAKKLTQAQGGVFRIVVVPATWEVHPNTLPTWARPLRGSNTLNKLMKKYPKLPWVDTRKALLAASQKKNVFVKVNSHWTNYGGYVAWKAIAGCLGTHASLDKVGVPPLASVRKDPNYNEFAGYGIKAGKKAWTVPVFPAPLPASTQTQTATGEEAPYDPYGGIDAVFLPAVVETPAAQSDQTLLVYRDSTGSALSPLWRYSYQTSYQYHHGILSDAEPTKLATAIAAADPDVFLYVISERMLDGKPPRA
jgi:hypothetical protein